MNSQPRAMVWGGHASRAAVLALLSAHVAALVWLCGDQSRLRLIGYDFLEVSSEALLNAPPDLAGDIRYTEDDPSELAQLRSTAERVVAGSANDSERLRRLGDYIYSLRRPDGASSRFV